MFLTEPELMPPAERSLGYAGLRRREILAHCIKYQHVIGPVDHAASKENLVAVMDGYVSQGKIPHPYQPPVTDMQAQAKELAETKDQLASLQAQINALMQGNIEMTAEPAELPAEEAEMIEHVGDAPTYDDLSWAELKKEARKAGLNTYGKKRPEVEAMMSALG